MGELLDGGLIISTGLLILCFKQHLRQSIISAGNLDERTRCRDETELFSGAAAPEVQLISAKLGLTL